MVTTTITIRPTNEPPMSDQPAGLDTGSGVPASSVTGAPAISPSIEVRNFSGGTFTVTVEQLEKLLGRQKTYAGRVAVRLERGEAYLKHTSAGNPELVLRADGNVYKANAKDRGATEPIAKLVSVSGTLAIVPPKLATFPYAVPETSAALDKVVNRIGNGVRNYFGISQPAGGATAIGQCAFRTTEYLEDYPGGDREVGQPREATYTCTLLSDGKLHVTKQGGHRGNSDTLTTDGYDSSLRTISDYIFPLWPIRA
jgi:hypothetical protein